MYRKKGNFWIPNQKSLRFNVKPFFIVNLCYKNKFKKPKNKTYYKKMLHSLCQLSFPRTLNTTYLNSLYQFYHSLFQACLIWVSRGTVGMSNNISNRAGILFSPFVTPDLTVAARAFVPPSRCEWRIPRDTLPPMADLREDFSLLLGRSFLSLLELLQAR